MYAFTYGRMIGCWRVCMSARIYVSMDVCEIYVCIVSPIESFKVLYLTTVNLN